MYSPDEIVSFCRFAYNSFQIPIYLYSREELVFSAPEELSLYHPRFYLNHRVRHQSAIDYTQTSNNCFYGIITIEKTGDRLILGPVSSVPLADSSWREMLRELTQHTANPAALTALSKIPLYSQVEFVDYLLLIQFILNKKQITREDFFRYQAASLTDTPHHKYVTNQFYSDSSSSDLLQPDSILMYIESGNVDGVMEYLCFPQNGTILRWGEENLVSHKQVGYYAVALFSEAARRGGLSMKECSEIVHSYYTDITKLKDVEVIDLLVGRCALFFAEKVRAIPLPQNLDRSLLSCVQYIRQNVYARITVNDVASHLGYSRSHASKLFKEELGFSPGEYIQRLKLEEGKILLSHSDKSVSEIASLLCFSSQSHFHRAFKKHFQKTPAEFRKQQARL